MPGDRCQSDRGIGCGHEDVAAQQGRLPAHRLSRRRTVRVSHQRRVHQRQRGARHHRNAGHGQDQSRFRALRSGPAQRLGADERRRHRRQSLHMQHLRRHQGPRHRIRLF